MNRYLPRNKYCPQQLSPPRSCSGSGRRNIQIKGSACAREFEEVRWSEMKGNQHHFSSGSPFFLQVASRAVETPCAWLACATQANNHTSVRNAIIGLMLRDSFSLSISSLVSSTPALHHAIDTIPSICSHRYLSSASNGMGGLKKGS